MSPESTRPPAPESWRPPSTWAVAAFLVTGLLAVGAGCEAPPPPDPDRSIRNTLQGRVFNEITGAEESGATVNLGVAPTFLPAAGSFREPSTFEPPGPLLQAVSGPGGEYSLAQIPQGHYRLEVAKPGFLPAIRPLRFPLRHTGTLDVGITPAGLTGDLALTLLDAATMAGIAAATVTDLVTRETFLTDAAGRVTLTGRAAGSGRFRFEAPGFATVEAIAAIPAGVETPVTFFVSRTGGVLQGRLTTSRPGGGALANAGLSLVPSMQTTVSAADGTFRIDALPEGLEAVTVVSPSHDRQVVTTSIVAGRITTLDLVMRFHEAVVTGRVADGAGTGIAGATVTIPAQVLTTSTDLAGDYRFDQVVVADPPRPIQIGALASGFLQANRTLVVAPGQTVQVDFTLLGLIGDLVGFVVEALGLQPIGGALLALPDLGASTTSDAAGSFRFDDLPAGAFQLDVSAVGFTGITTFVRVPAGDTASVTVVLRPP